MTDYTIPRANAPIAGTEAPSTQWYNFIRYLDTRSSSAAGNVQAEITVIAEKLGSPDGTVDNIPPLGNVTSVQGKQSIQSSGVGVVQLRLVNDVDIAGNVSYYGTDATGVKGWNAVFDAFNDSTTITKHLNTDGTTEFDLVDAPSDGNVYGRKNNAWALASSGVGVIGCTFNGAGAPITAGAQCDVFIPYGWTITSATLLADVTGSIVIDVWSDAYGSFPPTVADSITGSSPPTITGGIKSQDSTLTGWTTSGLSGVTFRFNVNSCATITRATLSLKVNKS